MASYKELLAQRAEVERQIEELRQAEVEKAVVTIRELMSEFDLSPLDIGYTRRDLKALMDGRGKKGVGVVEEKSGVAPKYRNPETGQTWSGRGRTPHWITPDTIDRFLIKA